MKIILLLTLSLALFAKSPLLPEASVAVVDGISISEDDLQREVNKLMPKSFLHSNVTDEKVKDLKIKAMKTLIDRALLYNYALSENLGATKEDVENQLMKMERTIKNKVKGVKDTRRFLIEGFKKNGVSFETLKLAIKKDITLDNLYKEKIKKTITNEDLKKYYEKNMYKFKEPEKRRVRLIYIRNNPSAKNGKEDARLKAKEAMKKIQDGADFGDIAAKYSNAMSRIKGGDMGFIHKGLLEPYVEEKSFKLKKGEISEIIEMDIGFYIVKIEDMKESKQLSFNKIKDGLRRDLKVKFEDKKRTDLLERLKLKSKIIR
ncbi:peptidylprolyl isomerase [Candidatus Sulfurimonas baltica]|uniref:peptidylprolyl isomerase n=1 Tax=Candidatus Sulfurimonas baltica TaxID=2740404 RepID=A0A7S7LUU2_9BACT|nr:peptidylprolyl isomerase [Candidatus Sulfurimonas baltica]QOY51871.1 peptidyl-prolyl cis-trans isomerase [Candidatus Sulfurimonas baltica]